MDFDLKIIFYCVNLIVDEKGVCIYWQICRCWVRS